MYRTCQVRSGSTNHHADRVPCRTANAGNSVCGRAAAVQARDVMTSHNFYRRAVDQPCRPGQAVQHVTRAEVTRHGRCLARKRPCLVNPPDLGWVAGCPNPSGVQGEPHPCMHHRRCRTNPSWSRTCCSRPRRRRPATGAPRCPARRTCCAGASTDRRAAGALAREAGTRALSPRSGCGVAGGGGGLRGAPCGGAWCEQGQGGVDLATVGLCSCLAGCQEGDPSTPAPRPCCLDSTSAPCCAAPPQRPTWAGLLKEGGRRSRLAPRTA